MTLLTSRLPLKILGGLFFIVALLALMQVPGLRPRDFFARQWRHQLSTSDDEHALEHLRKIAALDDAGIPILVESLGSPREVVVQGAHTILWEELDRWQLWKISHSSKRIALLAHHLSKVIEDLSPAGRRIAANLATRILHWPTDPKSKINAQVIADCDTVFRSSLLSTQVSSPVPLDMSRFKETISRQEPFASVRRKVNTAPELRTEEMAALPGGNLPLEIAKIPKAPVSPLLLPAAKETENDAPNQFFPETFGKPGSEYDVPRKLRPVFPRLRPNRPLETPENNLSSLIGIQTYGTEESGRSFRVTAFEEGEKKDFSDVEAMRLLHSPHPRLKKMAQETLIDRGFGIVQMELARQMFDPDPVVRRKLVETLPRIKSINTIYWLKWMLHDQDPEVRVTVVGIIASTRDPKMVRQLKELRISERDPRVLEQLKRVLKYQ